MNRLPFALLYALFFLLGTLSNAKFYDNSVKGFFGLSRKSIDSHQPHSYSRSGRPVHALSRRTLASPPATITSFGSVWTSQGCVTDGQAGALTGYMSSSSSNTPQTCVATCQSKGYTYAGLEYSSQCFCGSTLSNGLGTATTGCTNACSGNSTISCGGSYKMNLYKATTTGIATSSSYSYVGCYQDSGTRVLSGPSTTSSTLTVDSCTSYCFSAGYAYAGAEYGDECYCGSSLSSSLTSGTCAMACNGNSAQTCGGNYLISVYQAVVSTPTISGASFYGCVSDSSSARALTGYSTSSSTMTNAICTSTCFNMGYSLAGTEYSTQCFCGNSLSNSQTIGSASSCNMGCSGRANETCGGSNRLTVLQSTSASSTSTTASKTSSSSAASASATSSVSTTISGWTYSGCYTDSTSSRALTGFSETGQTGLTNEICTALCSSKGYAFAGTEYSSECYCGNAIVSSSSLSASSSCNYKCSGNSAETCGGSSEISIYMASLTAWTSLGCVTDGSSVALQGSMTSSSQMTVEVCQAYCKGLGYTIAGVEYSTQCFCGNSFANGLGVSTSASSCNMACAGNSSETCGGNYRLSAYSLGTVTSSSTSTSSASTSTSTVVSTCGSKSSYTPTLSAPSSKTTKSVFSHFMVGNTYPYTTSDWTEDITLAYNSGATAFALNLGTDSWQASQVASAYQVASSVGNGFKLFLSFDMSVWSCSDIPGTIASMIVEYAANSNQFLYNGKVLVSTFAGESCGDAPWTNLRTILTNQSVSMYFLPAFFSGYSNFTSYDGIFNWNSAWSMDANAVTTTDDTQWIAAASAKGAGYMPAISPLFFTHYGVNSYNKNWIYQSDNWPLSLRWQQIIGMRNEFDLVELITWNDYGESHYQGPIHGAQPNSQAWVNGFDHSPFQAVNAYYAQAFKTGTYPAITCDKIYLMARPHINTAVATADSAGAPPTLGQSGASGSDTAETNNFFALVFATAASTVTLSAGTSSSTTTTVQAGITTLSAPLVTGQGMQATLVRNGVTYVNLAPSYTFAATTTEYNFNYYAYASS